MTETISYANNTDPTDGGGGDLRILEEAAELSKRDHDVKIVAGRTDPDLPRTRTVDGVRIRTVKCLPDALARFETLYFYFTRMLFPLASLPALVADCRRRRPDLVVDDFTPHPSLAGFVAGVFSIPVLALVHEYHDRTALKKHPLPIGVIQLVVQNVLRTTLYSAVVVPREGTKRQLETYGVPVPIHVVPNGIEIAQYRDPPEAVSVDRYDLLVVSRLVHRKGIDLLIDAMQHVVAERPETTLGIAGSGPRRTALEGRVAEHGLEENVEFLGYVSEAEKVALLHRSDTFVFPSRQEGFGIAVLEAMATGTPVVVNDLAVLRELVPEDGGAFADADDPRSFARSLLGGVRLPPEENRARGRANVERAEEYSWSSVAATSERVYETYANCGSS